MEDVCICYAKPEEAGRAARWLYHRLRRAGLDSAPAARSAARLQRGWTLLSEIFYPRAVRPEMVLVTVSHSAAPEAGGPGMVQVEVMAETRCRPGPGALSRLDRLGFDRPSPGEIDGLMQLRLRD